MEPDSNPDESPEWAARQARAERRNTVLALAGIVLLALPFLLLAVWFPSPPP